MMHRNFGLQLSGEPQLTPSGQELVQLVHQHGYLLIRGRAFNEEAFMSLALSLGPPIRYAFGEVLNMEARAETAESQFTNASMPLHQDAILNKDTNAQFLSFLCITASRGRGGETLFTDNRAFMSIAPADLLDELRSVEFGYCALNKDYYDGDAEQGQVVRVRPLTRHPVTGEEVPYLALDDPLDPGRNYASFVVGYDQERSDALMKRVDQCLRSPDVLIAHEWQEGDVIMLDNFLVCHGRNPSQEGTARRLLRVATKALNS